MAAPQDIDAPPVLYWEKLYLQKYSGDGSQRYISQVDHEVLYNGLDNLTIKVAGQTTGVPSTDFFASIERPDFRNPFPVIVDNFIKAVNLRALDAREDNVEWRPREVSGIGPSRAYYFLADEVVQGFTADGFHRNEKILRPIIKTCENSKTRYLEYTGFECANRTFRFFHAPTFYVPDWDGLGPKTHQVGVHNLSVEARLHRPRAVWPGYRTPQESEDCRLGRVRESDCILCKTYAVLYNVGCERYRKKQELKLAGIRFPNSYSSEVSAAKYNAHKTTQTDQWPPEAPKPPMVYRSDKVASAAYTPTREEVIAKSTGLSYANRMALRPRRTRSRSPPTPQPPRRQEFTTPKGITRKRSSSVGSPLLTSTQEGNTSASRNLFASSTEKNKEAGGAHPKGDRRQEKLRRQGVQMYKQILQEEAAARAEHEENKRGRVYHHCPKLNWDYHNSSAYWEHRRKFEDEEGIPYDSTASSIMATDTSCNSTCECARSRTQNSSLATASSDTSRFNSSRTPQSTFLHVSVSEADDSKASSRPLEASTTGESFVTATENSSSSPCKESSRFPQTQSNPREGTETASQSEKKSTEDSSSYQRSPEKNTEATEGGPSCIPPTQSERNGSTESSTSFPTSPSAPLKNTEASSSYQTSPSAPQKSTEDTEGPSCFPPTQSERNASTEGTSSYPTSQSGPPEDTEGPSCFPPTQSERNASTDGTSSCPTSQSGPPEDTEGPSCVPPTQSDSFKPRHYTQIRPEANRISPQLQGQRHIIAVNENKAHLDVSLLPDNLTVLSYSPTKGVSYRTEDDPDDLDESPASPDQPAGVHGSPKRPPPSPSSSRPKRVASDPEDTGDFQFTQLEDLTDRKSHQ